MKRLKKLLCFLLLGGAALCPEANAAKKIICDQAITNDAAEARLVDGARTYAVKVTCRM